MFMFFKNCSIDDAILIETYQVAPKSTCYLHLPGKEKAPSAGCRAALPVTSHRPKSRQWQNC
jgi:hypothetical protein